MRIHRLQTSRVPLSGGVVGEGAAEPAELVVECDRGGERDEAAAEPGADTYEGAGPVTFEGEYVFQGPEDRLDPLADRSQMRPCAEGVTPTLRGTSSTRDTGTVGTR